MWAIGRATLGRPFHPFAVLQKVLPHFLWSLSHHLRHRSAELYGQFFVADFDPSRFANNIIQGNSITDSLKQLSAGITRLETELHSQVVSSLLLPSSSAIPPPPPPSIFASTPGSIDNFLCLAFTSTFNSLQLKLSF